MAIKVAWRKPVVGDLVVAAVALALALSAITLAKLYGWLPALPDGYVGAAIIAALAWPAARLAPRSALIAVAGILVAPWPFFLTGLVIDSDIRIVPLVVVAFRVAQLGLSAWFVIPVIAIATPIVVGQNVLRLGGEIEKFRTYGLRLLWDDPSTNILQAVTIVAISALGFVMHRQHEATEALHARNAELVELRASEGERIAIEVQSAIARDIHDVVAHHVAAMVVTAQTVERIGERDPERLRSTIREIASEGDDALSAMRSVVKVLRSSSNSGGEFEQFEPALQKLIGRLRSTGRQVSVSGELGGLAQFVEATILRIVQESLTNVMLHSDAHRVAVRFAMTVSDVEVLVEDDGQKYIEHAVSGGGNGIVGMQERARVLGGSVSAGPRISGGWEVKAILPRDANRALAGATR